MMIFNLSPMGAGRGLNVQSGVRAAPEATATAKGIAGPSTPTHSPGIGLSDLFCQ